GNVSKQIVSHLFHLRCKSSPEKQSSRFLPTNRHFSDIRVGLKSQKPYQRSTEDLSSAIPSSEFLDITSCESPIWHPLIFHLFSKNQIILSTFVAELMDRLDRLGFGKRFTYSGRDDQREAKSPF